MLVLPQRTSTPLTRALRSCWPPCTGRLQAYTTAAPQLCTSPRTLHTASRRHRQSCQAAAEMEDQQSAATAEQQSEQAVPAPTRPAWALLPIILGSQSASRRAIMDELAAQFGFSFSTVSAGIDEKEIRNDDPEELVMMLAHAKAVAIGMRWQEENAMPSEGLLITCDQVVLCNGEVLEKPENEEQARQYVHGYSNSAAQTVGAIRVTNLAAGRGFAETDICEVQFGAISDDIVDQLVAEDATYSCAGGLMVEHPLVSPLITAQLGEQASIMGLSKSMTVELLRKAALLTPRREAPTASELAAENAAADE